MRIALLLAGLGLAVLAHAPARAASIDCATAKGPLGLSICADPEVHRLDQDLGAGYDTLAAAASDVGKKQVRRDEHDRRAFIEERCAPTDKACLVAAYRQGIDSLARFNTQPKDAVLVPVEGFTLDADKTVLLSAYPRLDRPAAPWADGFEKAAHQAADDLRPDEPDTDAVIDYRPLLATPDLVAVAFRVWTMPHGAAHGIGRRVAFTYLPTQGRRLRPTDLFQSGTTWSGFLAQQAFDGLQTQAKAGGWDLTISGPGNLERDVANPANWLIHPDGLGLYFAPETVGPYVAGEYEVLVPWTDLKPYLAEKSAFAIPTTNAASLPSPSQP